MNDTVFPALDDDDRGGDPLVPRDHEIRAHSRRSVLRAAGLVPVAAGMAGLGWAVAPSEAEAASTNAPYPRAKRKLTRLDGNWLWRKGQGADQWASGQIDGGRILAAWGDGFGWNQSGKKGYIGVTEIGGSVTSPRGSDLWRNGSLPLKPCAMIANNGTPLMYVVSDQDGRSGSYLMRGSNGGRNWSSPSGPVVSRIKHGLVVIGSTDRQVQFANSGIGLYLAADGNLKGDALYSPLRNEKIYLAFLDRSTASFAGGWQWYAGYRNGNPANLVVTGRAPWESSGGVKPVAAFYDSNGAGKHFLTSWCPTTGTHIGVKTHQKNGLGVFSAPTPWGPWSTLWYGDLIANKGGRIFTAKAISMWSTGGIISIMWSGGPDKNKAIDYDAVFVTRFRYG